MFCLSYFFLESFSICIPIALCTSSSRMVSTKFLMSSSLVSSNDSINFLRMIFFVNSLALPAGKKKRRRRQPGRFQFQRLKYEVSLLVVSRRLKEFRIPSNADKRIPYFHSCHYLLYDNVLRVGSTGRRARQRKNVLRS